MSMIIIKSKQEIELMREAGKVNGYIPAVSYTHLDVYKRQGLNMVPEEQTEAM